MRLPASIGFANYQPVIMDAGALREFCAALEALGYAGIQVQDHVAYPWDTAAYGPSAGGLRVHHPGAPVLEALSFLSAAAAASRTLGLDASLVVLPQRHPLVVAKQAGAIERLSGGRLRLGVGPGWLAGEMAALGWDPRSRAARMDEALEVLTRALDDERVAFTGTHYRFDAVSLEPRPARRARDIIWVGGGEAGGLRAAMRRLGRHGSGWLVHPRFPMEEVPAALDLARAEARAAGRGEVAFGVDMVVLFDGDVDALDAALARRAGAGATRVSLFLGGLAPATSLDELVGLAARAAEVRPR